MHGETTPCVKMCLVQFFPLIIQLAFCGEKKNKNKNSSPAFAWKLKTLRDGWTKQTPWGLGGTVCSKQVSSLQGDLSLQVLLVHVLMKTVTF
jgi:hypothetical protein